MGEEESSVRPATDSFEEIIKKVEEGANEVSFQKVLLHGRDEDGAEIASEFKRIMPEKCIEHLDHQFGEASNTCTFEPLCAT